MVGWAIYMLRPIFFVLYTIEDNASHNDVMNPKYFRYKFFMSTRRNYVG